MFALTQQMCQTRRMIESSFERSKAVFVNPLMYSEAHVGDNCLVQLTKSSDIIRLTTGYVYGNDWLWFHNGMVLSVSKL